MRSSIDTSSLTMKWFPTRKCSNCGCSVSAARNPRSFQWFQKRILENWHFSTSTRTKNSCRTLKSICRATKNARYRLSEMRRASWKQTNAETRKWQRTDTDSSRKQFFRNSGDKSIEVWNRTNPKHHEIAVGYCSHVATICWYFGFCSISNFHRFISGIPEESLRRHGRIIIP